MKRSVELIEKWANQLTWAPWPEFKDYDEEKAWKNEHVIEGMLIREKGYGDRVDIYCIGNYDETLINSGCGCCSDSARPIEYAYIQELLPGLKT